MQKSMILLWIRDVPNVLPQTTCFHSGWIRLRVQKASCCKSKGKRYRFCWVKIAQLGASKRQSFSEGSDDLGSNWPISINHREYVMRTVNWKGFSKILFLSFLQKFASESWRRFTRQWLNSPVSRRDASASGSDDFSWHGMRGEPTKMWNKKHKIGDNYQRKVLAINKSEKHVRRLE